MVKENKNGVILGELLWYASLNLGRRFILLLMIFFQSMSKINGFLLKAKIQLNIGLAYWKKPTQNCMEDIIK